MDVRIAYASETGRAEARVALPELAPTAKRHDERPRAPGRADGRHHHNHLRGDRGRWSTSEREEVLERIIEEGRPRLDGKRYMFIWFRRRALRREVQRLCPAVGCASGAARRRAPL